MKDKVGYCNPPKATRFRKGVCPNPKGRPRKNDLPLGDLVIRALQSKMQFTERGMPVSASKLRVVIDQHILRALSGDIGSASALLKMREHALNNEDYGDTLRIHVRSVMEPLPKRP
jgi:uncharacterized protein DUF5681